MGARRDYHVVFDARAAQWQVCDDRGRLHGHTGDLHAATCLALRAAEHDHAKGLAVTVCIEERDGSHRQVWASP